MPGFLPSPPSNGFYIGPLHFHAYGLMYVVGFYAFVVYAESRWAAAGHSRKDIPRIAVPAFLASIVGGRLYYLITTPNAIPPHWWGPFALWDGGMGIWGGIAVGLGSAVLLARRSRVPIGALLDAAAPALLVGQAIGRIGNYFNQELFGVPTTLPWGLEIDLAHRPSGYLQDTTFTPIFLYEIVWDLTIAVVLARIGKRTAVGSSNLFALYLAGYGLGRIGEEFLRIDPSRHILGLRLNIYVATTVCAIGVSWFVSVYRRTTDA
jgi:prolipoprotein diacylglyceryl transferase